MTDVHAPQLRHLVRIELIRAFLLVAVLMSGLAAWLLHAATTASAEHKRRDMMLHYQERLADFQRERENEAMRTRATLEMGGYLSERGSGWQRLGILQTMKGGNLYFSHIALADATGTLLVRYGQDADRLPDTLPGAEPVSWAYSDVSRTLFEIYRLPTRIDRNEQGYLLLLTPLDNALLTSLDYPDVELFILWKGRPVASSHGRKGIEHLESYLGRERKAPSSRVQADLPFAPSDPDSPRLLLWIAPREILSIPETIGVMLFTLAVLALTTWALLGRWLNALAGRLFNLDTATQSFASARSLTPEVRALLSREAGKGPIETRNLSASLLNMMESLVDYHEKLIEHEKTLLDRQKQLTRQADELRKSKQELERLAYVSSHDLQEPLRKVVTFAELLDKRYADRLDGEARRYLDHVMSGAMRMRAQIRSLLAYSELEAETSATTSVDLETIVDQCLLDLHPAIAETGARITRDPLPTVRANRKLMECLFHNLLDNALKFRAEATPEIRILARRDGTSWTLGVMDNGMGIEPAYADKVFVMFQRLHTRETYGGIGLAICRKIVEQHGGRIWVESTPGTGSTFYFTLPDRQ